MRILHDVSGIVKYCEPTDDGLATVIRIETKSGRSEWHILNRPIPPKDHTPLSWNNLDVRYQEQRSGMLWWIKLTQVVDFKTRSDHTFTYKSSLSPELHARVEARAVENEYLRFAGALNPL